MSASSDRTVVIIQARMGSTRLPGKVMKDLKGHSVLWHVVDRVRRARGVDEVVVATSTKPSDDVIEREAKMAGASCFRGREQDVLDRYYEAATFARASAVVRVTSDCPLYDPDVLSRMLARWKEKNAKGRRVDYLSNAIKRTFPRGLDTEIFSFAALERAHEEATRPEEREHVTLYINGHPDTFSLDNFENDVDLSSLRWTLDTEDDWRLIETVYERLSPSGQTFATQDVLALLKREPALARLNAHVEQKKLGRADLVAPVNRVLIRTDASAEIGSGHVMRCLTLAEALRSQGADITFIGRRCEGNYLEYIRSKGFNAVPLTTNDVSAPLEGLEEKADWLVVDHYGLDAAWESAARSAARRLFVIDDLANRPHDCDVLLDQNYVHSMETRYQGLVPLGCRVLLGPSYALLRKDFQTSRPRRRGGEIGKVLVFFGGADPHGLTMKTLNALGDLAERPSVDVVIGLAYRDEGSIADICRRNGFTLHIQTDRMLQLLDQADLVIGAGGTATWERCRLGVPSVTVIAADNQREITEAVAARGATVNLGDAASFSPAKVTAALGRLAREPQAVRELSKNALGIMNGGRPGVELVIDAMREAA